MTADTLVMPDCGITYQNVKDCAGMRVPEAANRLGVHEETLRNCLKRFPGLHGLFKRPKAQSSKLTKRKLSYYARLGYTIKDTAEAIGYSYVQVRRMIKRLGIRELFPNQAEGMWIARRGYAQ